ncbi:MAG TPA: HIT domain-containing protein [Mesotoga sp.]|jgi:histidine triad (HIT) family protein|nr:HIT domain-containing protein [Mesotoga sp.]MDI9375205.1 HIT domain-containing protein [Thermotogota bacterium]MDD4039411.1 HIT domain-containing protein [Mesotoga sp.]MDD4477801.1 HIT domain-containing protein [Mesotoga sp.]MDD5744400.1 HIT domain-containing protein [Mesotoga sp.]
MECVFCKIAGGHIKSALVSVNEDFVAFDDINPVASCHVLVVPKRHIKSIKELSGFSGQALKNLLDIIDIVADEKGVKETGYRVIVNQGSDAGQEVEHLHFHVIGGRKLGRLG